MRWAVVDLLEARELEHDLSGAFGDRVIVSHEGAEVLLYAGSREQAELARDHLRTLAGEQGWDLEFDLQRWHPIAEKWEARGYPEFEVRVDLPSRHEAVRFAEQLTAEGAPAVHRWSRSESRYIR